MVHNNSVCKAGQPITVYDSDWRRQNLTGYHEEPSSSWTQEHSLWSQFSRFSHSLAEQCSNSEWSLVLSGHRLIPSRHLGFFYQFVAVFNQGLKKTKPKPNTFHLIKICNENRSLHTQQETGFFSECVTEPGNPSAKTSWALPFPASHCSYQGVGSFRSGECLWSLHCSTLHIWRSQGSRKTDFPQNSADRRTNWSCSCSKCFCLAHLFPSTPMFSVSTTC